MNRRLPILAAAAIIASVACSDKRSILTDPVGDTAFGFQMQQAATNMPRGSVRFVYKFPGAVGSVRPDSFVVSFAGLDSLQGASYVAWAGDSLGGTFKRITGTLTAVRTDSVIDVAGNPQPAPTGVLQLGNVSAIQHGNPRTQYTWRFERIAAGLTPADSMQVFLISIETNANATSPTPTRRPFWARRGEGSPSAATGLATATLRFGTFGTAPGTDYLYISTPARGRGSFWGNLLQATDSTLARPPLGFYYAVFAIKFVPFGQTTGDTLFVGELTSPWPRRHLSLFNADSIITDPAVVLNLPPSILAGSVRIMADTIGLPAEFPYKGFTEVWLTLQSKDAVRGRPSPNRILRGTVPFVVSSGQR